ncbi:hypothetical protein M3I53_23450 [Paraburkholderia sp. CNPSo 3272]|uniref:hypothetical protein n=1 Tax=Paraburkholderia sp. CNPSo 3272 TaxID=2940931 RepID=UPI0020B8AE15|nr:hypothetical protein [Paraburkholderia sp. CNPSo 3272]MCP3726048.1 hypothetical protein [Paraburkholderia sp. CNPSo 3272]
MSIIVIKDLTESVELDREAMAAIVGGARVASQRTLLVPRPFIGVRVEIEGSPAQRGPGTIPTARPRPTLLR